MGLRVFDDAGAGYFSWVENALAMGAYESKQFRKPDHGGQSFPGRCFLERRYDSQLGQCWKTSSPSSRRTGSSLPSRRGTVLPVTTPRAELSGRQFVRGARDVGRRQRHRLSYLQPTSHAGDCCAGRTIVSTVPDYVGNNNGITDDYASFSGTSMAVPLRGWGQRDPPRGDGVRRLHEHHAGHDLRSHDGNCRLGLRFGDQPIVQPTEYVGGHQCSDAR